ncbi:transmembrane protein 154 isoform X2 [Dendrobates tinctorius]|uniref:transmembrane protein 154 isoform X2 n=1 Tax=Dendrobates tinctorius TaxID=92724 RepID=UPI003CCA06AA
MEETSTEEELAPTSQTYTVVTADGDQTLSTITSDVTSDSNPEVTEASDGSDSEVMAILTYAAPAIILVLLLIPIVIFIVKRKRRKKLQEDLPGDEDVKRLSLVNPGRREQISHKNRYMMLIYRTYPSSLHPASGYYLTI